MQDNQAIISAPESVVAGYEAYKNIPVPYYRAKHGKTIKNKIYKGKGTADEITQALASFHEQGDNKKMLEEHGIGIDCSGFVIQLYDIYTMEVLHKHAWQYFTRKTLNPLNILMFYLQPIVSKINADTLTSQKNATKINAVKDAKPLDLIRMNGGKHVAMIYKIYKRNDIVEKIEYVHSTEGVGVCHGFVIITDPDKSIVQQQWLPLPDNAKPLRQPADLIKHKINNNGVRRPLFLV